MSFDIKVTNLVLRMHVVSLGKPIDSTSLLKALSDKLDIKRHPPSILFVHANLYLMLDTGSNVFSEES